MSLKINPNARLEVRQASANGLLRATLFFQATHTKNLAKTFPPASSEGEYPHARTFNLRQSVQYEPTDIATIAREQRIRIGYLKNAWYGVILELGVEPKPNEFIRPKGGKKFLRWVRPDGKVMFARKVRKMGIKPRKGLMATLEQLRRRLAILMTTQ